MKQTHSLTNEQIAIVFIRHIGANVLYGQVNPIEYKLTGIRHTKGHADNYTIFVVDEDGQEDAFPLDENSKLILTSSSAISDGDAIEVGELKGDDPYIRHRPNLKQIVKYIRQNVDEWCEKNFKIYEYLRLRGYAVPLFYGVNHPLNGKTAIEVGLALDKTKV